MSIAIILPFTASSEQCYQLWCVESPYFISIVVDSRIFFNVRRDFSSSILYLFYVNIYWNLNNQLLSAFFACNYRLKVESRHRNRFVFDRSCYGFRSSYRFSKSSSIIGTDFTGDFTSGICINILRQLILND